MKRRWVVLPALLALLLARGAVARADDADEGRKLFKVKCYICHTANDPYEARFGRPGLVPVGTFDAPRDGLLLRVQNRFGPNLRGVFGSPAGRRKQEGYVHSPSFQEAMAGIVWTEENLDKWLTKTWDFIPGTWMYLRVPDPLERRQIIAFLKQYP